MDPLKIKALVRRTRKIDGWLEPEAGYLLALLDQAQRDRGLAGDVVEIGVHHGKSAMLLAAMVDPATERLVVCDLFGAQDANVSDSGRGDRATFMENARTWYPEGSFIQVVERPSRELSADMVGKECRLFHIDGGHSREEALGDLRLAAGCLRPGGAIVIDDAFRAVWPAVTEAILAFLSEPGTSEFVPLVLGFNKLVLVRAGDEEVYRRLLDDPTARDAYIPRRPFEVKSATVTGRDVYVFHVPTYRRRLVGRDQLYRFVFQYADLIPAWAIRSVARARRASFG